jgi:hypothetical protein
VSLDALARYRPRLFSEANEQPGHVSHQRVVAGASERAELAIDQKATLLLVVATWGNQVVDRDNVGVVSQTYES